MSKKLTKEEVLHVAKLARIGLTREEQDNYSKQITSVLEYIEKLDEIDTSKIEATSQVTNLEHVLRKDEVKPSLTQRQVLSTSNKSKDGFVQAQPVIN